MIYMGDKKKKNTTMFSRKRFKGTYLCDEHTFEDAYREYITSEGKYLEDK